MSPAPPSPVPICLLGSKPGAFDATQPSRLLRYPESTLLFASFNPLAGSGPTLSVDAFSRARRIVVEAPQADDVGGRPNWFSFVPDATLAPGVVNEGKWPRVIKYCGRWAFCDQDQWDIHKLDPLYECFVPTPGLYSTITKKTVQSSFEADQSLPPSQRGHSYGEAPPAVSSTVTEDLASGAFFKFVLSSPVLAAASSPLPLADEQARTRQPGHGSSIASDAVVESESAAHALVQPDRLRRRLNHHQEWTPWTQRRAIERYLVVSEQFDGARFSCDDPVDPLFIPWPVLIPPFTFQWNQVDGALVRAFFDKASSQLSLKEYRTLLMQSQKRFHPDRLRVRGVFRTHDGELAEALERACLTVIQVVNSIWDDFKVKYNWSF